jgi:excisionase family DNA binding protein
MDSVVTSSDVYMLTLKEAAAELGVSLTKLRNAIGDGELKTIQWGNEQRIPRWYLREWQSKQLDKIQDMVEHLLSGSKVRRANQRVKGKDSTIPNTSTDYRKCD